VAVSPLLGDLMTAVIIFCLLAAGSLFAYRKFGKRKVKQSSDAKLYLLIFDGQSWIMYETVRENGCFVVDGVEYATSSCKSVEWSSAGFGHLYVFAAEPIALTTHNQLMKHRAAVIKGHLFKSGGDMTRLVNMVAAGAVLACALFVYMSVSGLNSANVQQQVLLEKIDKWTQSPLQIQR
jgi:hypothetical protein